MFKLYLFHLFQYRKNQTQDQHLSHSGTLAQSFIEAKGKVSQRRSCFSVLQNILAIKYEKTLLVAEDTLCGFILPLLVCT